jgi:uncharacterized repeat protein (TIGR01451 family)
LTADPRPVDVGVTKTVTADPEVPLDRVPLGSTVTFTVAATNTSTDPAGAPATNVVFADILEPTLQIDSSTPSNGTTFDPTTGEWSIPTLASGDTVTLTLRATTTATGQHTNTIALSSLTEADTDPTNNSSSASITVTDDAELAITKSNTPTTAQPGDRVDYEITVTNNGPNDASVVTAYDPAIIDAQIVDVDLPAGTNFDPTLRVWIIPTLADGDSVTLGVSIVVRPSRSGLFINTVAVTSSAQPDPDLSNNVDDASLFVPAADITVQKHVDRGEPSIGDTVTYTVTVDNRGPDPAQAVTIDDLLPTGLALVAATPSVGSYDARSGVWTIGDLAPIELVPPPTEPQATLNLLARVETAGTFTNRATSDRTIAFPFDPDEANNAASAVVTAIAPTDISLTKSMSPMTAEVGGTVTVTLTIANAGPSTADDVVLHDTFPAELVSLAASDERCSISGPELDCALGSLAADASTTVTVTATASIIGETSNTAVIATASTDVAPGNNTSTAFMAVTAPTTTTSSTTTSNTTTTSPPETSNPGGPLATTGSDPRPIVALAVGLIAIGLVAVGIAQVGSRRRIS